MNGRVLLAFCALALFLPVSGCAAGSLQMTAVNDTELARHASHDLPTANPRPEVDTRAVVTRAVESGSTTVTDTSLPLDPTGRTYAVDGAYYDLVVEPTGNRTEWSVNALIDYNGSIEGPATDYADLPPADRHLIAPLVHKQPSRLYEGYDAGVERRYTRAELEAAVFSEEYIAVRREGERYAVRAERKPVTVTAYRYTATEVAPDAEAYGASVRERYGFTLSAADLSSSERALVAEAINGTYYAGSAYDDVFRSMLDRFHTHDAVPPSDSGESWVVRYDGTTYWAELEYEPISLTR